MLLNLTLNSNDMLDNELAEWQVVEICVALKHRAEDLEKRGCASLALDVVELRRRILSSHIILTPFNSNSINSI